MDTVAQFIWLPVSLAIQAHFVEMHVFSSSRENELSNSISSGRENNEKFSSVLDISTTSLVLYPHTSTDTDGLVPVQ